MKELPRITVDMGAVPHVCNGSDVMAPGIRKIEGDFVVGSLLTVVDERHGKFIAVGESLLGLEEMKAARRGKVIKNLHYVGDKVWDAIKTP